MISYKILGFELDSVFKIKNEIVFLFTDVFSVFIMLLMTHN